MVESYLHKMAKELLYKEIEEKSGFEYKLSNGEVSFESLISREDYRGECVLMEFPTHDGSYPDEFGCTYEPPTSCEFCVYYDKDNNSCIDGYVPVPYCVGSTCIKYTNGGLLLCKNPKTGFRFNSGNGYCKCAGCDTFDFDGCKIHDIAAFWKGTVVFAIEIINKHEPDWIKKSNELYYNVYLVRAEDVLKRIGDTPIYVNRVVGRGH